PLRSYVSWYTSTQTSKINTLSLHDALPIYQPLQLELTQRRAQRGRGQPCLLQQVLVAMRRPLQHRIRPLRRRRYLVRPASGRPRSEEHTSELQSRENLVCRLLLEKKKATHY